jgi:hypothetical protein
MSRPTLGYTMDTGLQDSLRHLYDSGFRRGYASAKIDIRGAGLLGAAIGFVGGVVVGLLLTGWL